MIGDGKTGTTSSRRVCAGFFDRLVTPCGTKFACCLDDLIKWAGDLADEVLHGGKGPLGKLAFSALLKPPASQPNAYAKLRDFSRCSCPCGLGLATEVCRAADSGRDQRERNRQKHDQERAQREQEAGVAKIGGKVEADGYYRNSIAVLCMIMLAGLTLYARQQRTDAITFTRNGPSNHRKWLNSGCTESKKQ